MSNNKNADLHRDFAGRGLLINLLRALHLVGVVGIGATVLVPAIAPGVPGNPGDSTPTGTPYYAWLLIATGMAIIGLDRWANTAYFRQINGQWILFKLLVLCLVGWLAGIGAVLFLAVLVCSVLMTHAPRWLRHRKLF
ncbi:MAG: hypothetical protein WC073_15950 [Sterolibacterium sp.]